MRLLRSSSLGLIVCVASLACGDDGRGDDDAASASMGETAEGNDGAELPGDGDGDPPGDPDTHLYESYDGLDGAYTYSDMTGAGLKSVAFPQG